VPKQLFCLNNGIYRSRDSVVGIATGYVLDDRGVGVRVPVGSRIFSSPRRPDRLWGPRNLLSNGYRGALSRGVKMTTHLQLVPRPRKCGSIHPLPHTPLWCSAWLVKHKDNFTITNGIYVIGVSGGKSKEHSWKPVTRLDTAKVLCPTAWCRHCNTYFRGVKWLSGELSAATVKICVDIGRTLLCGFDCIFPVVITRNGR
jgi:hypothetical protein